MEVDHPRTKAGSNIVTNCFGRRHAHVSAYQSREQIAQKFFINQATFALEEVSNVGVECLTGFRQRISHFRKHAGFWLRGLFVSLLGIPERHSSNRIGQGTLVRELLVRELLGSINSQAKPLVRERLNHPV
ncbi:MAG: hypothetical protein WBD31_15105 [Rubripirellula sp.]